MNGSRRAGDARARLGPRARDGALAEVDGNLGTAGHAARLGTLQRLTQHKDERWRRRCGVRATAAAGSRLGDGRRSLGRGGWLCLCTRQAGLARFAAARLTMFLRSARVLPRRHGHNRRRRALSL